MSITELTGRPDDPDCLHCVLPPIIDKFMREHPEKPAAQVISEVAQALGDLIGSAAFNSGHTGCVTNIVTGAARQTLRAAVSMVDELKSRRV